MKITTSFLAILDASKCVQGFDTYEKAVASHLSTIESNPYRIRELAKRGLFGFFCLQDAIIEEEYT